MKRKITHYVVKPEHREHFHRFTGYNEHIDTLTTNDRQDAMEIQSLTEAKVLDLWCEPVYEKERVRGWYNVAINRTLQGPWGEERFIPAFNDSIGHVFIDQEIE